MQHPGDFPENSPEGGSDDQARETGLARLTHVATVIGSSRPAIIERARTLITAYLNQGDVAEQLASDKLSFDAESEQRKKDGKKRRGTKSDLMWLNQFLERDDRALWNGKSVFRRVLPYLAEASEVLDRRRDELRLKKEDLVSYLLDGTPLPVPELERSQPKSNIFPFARVVPGDPAEADIDGFYNAEPQGLPAIAAGCDVLRTVFDSTNGLRDRIFSGERFPMNVIVLNGPSGAGKSILLDRIAHEALQRKWAVFRCSGALLTPTSFFAKLGEVADCGSDDILIVIDSADSALRVGMSPQAVSHFRSGNDSVSITTVMAMNLSLLSADLRSRLPAARNFAVYHVDALDSRELEALVQAIIQAESDGRISNRRTVLTKEERLAKLELPRDRIALIALLTMRYGQGVREVVREEIEPLSDPTKRSLRRCALLERLGTAMPSRLIAFHDGASAAAAELRHLIRYEAGRCYIRHPRLVIPTLDVTLPSASDRSDEFLALLRDANASGGAVSSILVDIFTLRAAGRRVMALFKYDYAVTAGFVEQMIEMAAEFSTGPYGSLLLGFLGQVSKDALADYETAVSLFERASAMNPDSAFLRRQLAWSYHKQGNIDLLTTTALAALDQFPDAVELRSDCAHLLAMTVNVNSITTARKVIGELVRDNPDDRQLKRRLERIEQFFRIGNAQQAGELPEWAVKELPLDRVAWRARQNGERYYKRALFSDLSKSISQSSFDLELMRDIENVRVDNSDKKLRALINAHSGRYLYQRWYVDDEQVDLVAIETLMREAVLLWPEEPFVHCWLGTLLKEVKNDFAGAKFEYSEARRYARQSKIDHLVEHPMILNNIALLKMDMVRAEVLDAQMGLTEAASDLGVAVKGLVNHPHFTWPLQTKSELETLCSLKHVPFPAHLF